MKITILITDFNHPVVPYIRDWINTKTSELSIDLINKKDKISGGDILFLVSCHEYISKQERDMYKKTLLIHASDLPKGRGWSPHIWSIIEGNSQITLCLLDAEDKIDTGDIYKKIKIEIDSHELWYEINDKLFKAELELMDYAISFFETLKASKQKLDSNHVYYSKRTPEDSILDPNESIKNQFNKLRIMDPDRYPAYFLMNGHKYKLTIKKYE